MYRVNIKPLFNEYKVTTLVAGCYGNYYIVSEPGKSLINGVEMIDC